MSLLGGRSTQPASLFPFQILPLRKPAKGQLLLLRCSNHAFRLFKARSDLTQIVLSSPGTIWESFAQIKTRLDWLIISAELSVTRDFSLGTMF